VPLIGTKPQLEKHPHAVGTELEAQDWSVSDQRANIYRQLSLAWDRRRFLGKVFAVGLAVGALIAFLIPSRYESTVELMPPDSQSGSGLAMLAALSSKNGPGGMGAIAGDLLGMKSSGALFVGVLSSATVQDRIREKFDLKKVYGVKLEEDARKKLAENTNLGEDRKSGIISITVTDRNPGRAAAISQAYIGELNRLVVDLSTSAAHRERVFLEQRLIDVKKDLDESSVKFSQFASKNAAIDIKEQGRAMVEAASVLQGQLIAAQSELKGLEQIYTASNFRVRAVQARISELQTQLDKLGGKGFGDADQKTSASPSLYPSIRQLPLLGVTYADLYRQTKIEEVVFETLTQQYELAKVQEAKEIPSIKVLDAARIPERKSFPPRLLIICLSAVLFFAAAVMGLYVRSKWDEKSPSDPARMLAHDVSQSVQAWVLSSDPGESSMQTSRHRFFSWLGRGRGASKSSASGTNQP
jgi:capsule polysaccharide export protein KpsE/RkpR